MMSSKEVRKGEWEARLADIKYTLYLFRKNPLVLVGTLIVLFFLFLALFSSVIVDPNLAYPSGYQLLKSNQ